MAMAYTAADIVAQLRYARKFVLRHVAGLTDEQMAFKPYPECKSVLETLAHLISDDRCALDCLRTGDEPDYAAYDEPVTDGATLLARLAETHEALCGFVLDRYADASLDAEACVFGEARRLGDLPLLASEDFYHAGQIAFVRMATDPGWDYYSAAYGPEP
jgi:uncharacterized damage-inducible protein DinB